MSNHRLVIPKNRELVGGDLLAQSLKQLGVTVAFGLHGGHLDAFLMGATDAGIRLVDTRHETVSVQAAEGYSKIKNEVGVCFVTANSGFCNGIPGLATAFADRSSIFCITSSAPARDAETNALQGFHDQVVLSKPMTKFAHRVAHAEEIPRLVAHAFRLSTAGSPGPVLVDFPIDILFSPVHQSRISWGSLNSPPPYPPGPHPEAIEKAVELIKTSSRPVFVTGTGARSLQESAIFEKLITSTQIPVFHSLKYTSPLAFSHPCRAGVANLLSILPMLKKPEPDLVILLGARTGMMFGSRSTPCIPQPTNCKYIQVDTDGGEIGRAQPIDIGITADVRPFIAALAAALDRTPYHAPPAWTQLATSLQHTPSPFAADPADSPSSGIHPFHALQRTFAALPPDSIITIDGGEAGSWTAMTAPAARPHAVLFACGYLGFLGNGWGYSLGAAVAAPERLVVNVQGDGSAGFHAMELDTYARHGCRVLTVVVNNSVWGMSVHGQELVYGPKGIAARPVSALGGGVGFANVAKGLGVDAERVDKAESVEGAVQKLLSSGSGPALLELIVSASPTHPGTVAMVGMTDDKDVVVIPYYDNVPRS